jgi:hypothetical protein
MNRVNDQLHEKADASLLRAVQDEAMDEVSRQVAACGRDLERAVDACAHQCESRMVTTAAEVAGLRQELKQYRAATAEAAAEAPTAKQVHHEADSENV